MEKVVRKFSSFTAADEADDTYYAALSGNEKLQMLLDLIMPEDPHEAVIERYARVYPLADHDKYNDT
ncbi:MAG TPA: hypothetical protein VGH16_07975 [Candidatus Binatia bacterium]